MSTSQLIGELSNKELTQRADHEGLGLRSGPFRIRLYSDDAPLLTLVQQFYRDLPALPGESLFDITLSIYRARGIRRWWNPQISMHADAQTPFEPFPRDHNLPLFEWSLNWLIAMQAHQFLMLHSAVIEKDGWALVMPAFPGSGKSTLCTALMLRGWRLLSDEFGLIRPNDPALALHPLPRPIPLKNASIEVIRQFSSEAEIGPVFPKTRKGDVAHVKPSTISAQRAEQAAPPAWFLFPQFKAGQATEWQAHSPGWTFLKISGNSFNYRLQGARGFEAVADLAEKCPSYGLNYSDLDQAITQIEQRHRQIIDQKASAIPAD